MSVLAPENGTYKYLLESAGEDGEVVYDVALYCNHAISPLFRTDLSNLVPNIESLVFDRYQKLWIWTGDLMIPVEISVRQLRFRRRQPGDLRHPALHPGGVELMQKSIIISQEAINPTNSTSY